MKPFDLAYGQRLAIVGKTGTGKSTFARRVLLQSPYRWVIFNPKGTKALSNLPDSRTLTRISEAHVRRSIRDAKYTILNFPNGWRHDSMDDLLLWLIEQYEEFGICVDELYTMHNGGRAGAGLIGLITRGRELGQSFIGCTQRPAWCSAFVFSEADYVAEFRLTRHDDLRVMYDNTGSEEALVRQRGHDFLYFDVADDHATIYRA